MPAKRTTLRRNRSDGQAPASADRGANWWLGYVLRYAVGTAIAGLCLLSLVQALGAKRVEYLVQPICAVTHSGQPIIAAPADSAPARAPGPSSSPEKGCLGEQSWQWMLALLAFTYCYFVSVPIAVWHAGRFIRCWGNDRASFFWIAWAIVLSGAAVPLALGRAPQSGIRASALLLGALWIVRTAKALIKIRQQSKSETAGDSSSFCTTRCTCPHARTNISSESKFPWPAVGVPVAELLIVILIVLFALLLSGEQSSAPMLEVLSVPALWILVNQYSILWGMFNHKKDGKNSGIESTLDLVNGRARVSTDKRDTYTHLREHSSGVIIVVGLVSITCLMHLGIAQLPKAADSIQPMPWLVIAFAMVWLLPAVYLWNWAHQLERNVCGVQDD